MRSKDASDNEGDDAPFSRSPSAHDSGADTGAAGGDELDTEADSGKAKKKPKKKSTRKRGNKDGVLATKIGQGLDHGYSKHPQQTGSYVEYTDPRGPGGYDPRMYGHEYDPRHG